MNIKVVNKKIGTWWWTETTVGKLKRAAPNRYGDDKCGIQIEGLGKLLDFADYGEENGPKGGTRGVKEPKTKRRLWIEKPDGTRRWTTRKLSSKLLVAAHQPPENDKLRQANGCRMVHSVCREVAYRLGNSRPQHTMGVTAPLFIYEDDIVKITASAVDLTMEIEKKENRNPVVYVNETGNMYRWHGEFYDIEEHVGQLGMKGLMEGNIPWAVK